MKRWHHKTNPRVVQTKNRTGLSPTLYNQVADHPSLYREKPGFGYRHILRQQDVTSFLRLLPDWQQVVQGLNAVLLADGRGDCDGWYIPGVVAVCAWERGLWRELTWPGYAAHRELF